MLLALLAGAGCEPGERGEEATPLPPPASAGEVRRAELDRFVLALSEDERRPADGESREVWTQRQLEAMVVDRLLLARADTLPEDAATELQSRRAAARDGTLIAVARQRRIVRGTAPDDEEIRRYFDDNPAEFGHPEEIRVRHIFKRVARDADEATRQAIGRQAELLRQRALEGERFTDLARAHSDSETSRLDGLIGRLTRGAMDASIDDLLWSLDEGELSEVVSTPVGFHVFKVDDHLDAFSMDFEEASGRIRRRLQRLQTESRRGEVLTELLELSGATLHDGPIDFAAPPETVLFENTLADETLTVADFRELWFRLSFSERRRDSLEEQLRESVLSRLLLWEAQGQELASETAVAATLAEAENDVIRDFVLERLLFDEAAAVGDEALEAFFIERRARFRSPRLHRLRMHLRHFADEEQPYVVFEELSAVRKRVLSGEADLAAISRSSDDPTSADSGDLGWLRLDNFIAWAGPGAQIVSDLEVGELSEPILLENYDRARLKFDRLGFFLVRIEEIREPLSPNFEDVRGEVIQKYLAANRARVRRRLEQRLLQSIDLRLVE